MQKFVKNLRMYFDEEDWGLLGRIAEAEKLPKVQILKRALRVYDRVLQDHPELNAPKVPIREPRSAA